MAPELEALVMQLTFSYFAVLLSVAGIAVPSSPANLFLLITPPLLTTPVTEESSVTVLIPGPAPSSEGMGGVDVLTLRTETDLGMWS